MSVRPSETHPDPRTIADDLRERLVAEGWPEEDITTQITIWADGDCQVEVWHSIDNEPGDPTEKIEYTHHPDGTIECERLKLDAREVWNVIDTQIVTKWIHVSGVVSARGRRNPTVVRDSLGV